MQENKDMHVTRRKVQFYEDSYLEELKLGEVAVCRECRSVYANKRWQLESQAEKHLASAKQIVETLCPACEKIRDRQPGGILTISGRFVLDHRDEIVNLVHNQNSEAMEMNPLERVMDIEPHDGGLVVQTTNEKLAQKIGRALFKAYDGDVEYKWSKGTKLVRVNWRRDL